LKPRAQLLGLGRNRQKRVDLAVGKQFERSRRLVGHPANIAPRIEPDPRRQSAEKDLCARPERLGADAFAPEIGDPPDCVAGEQLEAADMYLGQNRNRRTAVDRGDELRRKVQREIAISACNHLRGIGIRGGFQIANISEAFGAQQLLGGVLRGERYAGIAHQSDRGRLR